MQMAKVKHVIMQDTVEEVVPGLPSGDAATVAHNVALGNLRSLRTKGSVARFDAVLNLSCKTACHVGPALPYCSVEIPDTPDISILLPKLIYAVRWLVDQVWKELL